MTYEDFYNEFMQASDMQLIGIWENGVYLTNTEYSAYRQVLKDRGIDLDEYMRENYE